MKKIIRFFFALAAMMISGSAFAQISHGGSPLFNHAMDKAVTTRIDLDEINNDLLLREDESRTKGSGPMRVGVMQDVAIDVVADGKVLKDAQGTHFLLSVNSPGASFVSLHFSDFQLSEGSTVFFYDQSGDVVLGSFLPEDVMDDGTFYTQSIPGSTIYIEYFVPAGQEPGRLVVDQLCPGYRQHPLGCHGVLTAAHSYQCDFFFHSYLIISYYLTTTTPKRAEKKSGGLTHRRPLPAWSHL